MPSSYFAFGSNLSRARLVGRVGPVEVVGPAVVSAWAHRFSTRGADGTGKGNIEPGDARVWGVVYRLADAQLRVLDEFEWGYERRTLAARVEGDPLQVVTYVGRRPGPLLPPAAWYLAHYRVGIREHGLPDAWLQEIERQARDASDRSRG